MKGWRSGGGRASEIREIRVAETISEGSSPGLGRLLLAFLRGDSRPANVGDTQKYWQLHFIVFR